jgi:dihydropteroate synthase
MSEISSDFSKGLLPCGLFKSDQDLSKHVYIRNLAPFQKGRFIFPAYEVSVRFNADVQRFQVSKAEILSWAAGEGHGLVQHVSALLENFERPQNCFAGLKVLNRPLIMGIVNVTPDSFSDGGDNFDAQTAIANGEAMLKAGADILDIGGESTRPGAAMVPLDEELRRVIPVIESLKTRGAVISIDTRNAKVMEAALNAGADIINDVTALEGEGSLETAARLGVPVMIMHIQGEPQTMQENPVYEDCALDVYDYLHERIRICETAGIKRENICVDPGIGFGKNLSHNMEILNQLGLYHGLGCTILLGASRKSFIAKICGDIPAKERLPGSLAAALQAANTGTQFVRVHDVAETKQALDVWTA